MNLNQPELKLSPKPFRTIANIFIHIPKTSGNSVISGLSGANFKCAGHDLRGTFYKHPSEICSVDDYIFTIVRNPYTRLLSAYYYLVKGGNSAEDANDTYMLGIRTMSFPEFIKKRLHQASEWQIHFLPQNYFLQNVPRYEIFYFEDLPNVFIELCNKFNLHDRQLPALNASGWSGDFHSQYTSQTLKIVRKVYAADFEKFNYSTSINTGGASAFKLWRRRY